jgi:hypothetical protein
MRTQPLTHSYRIVLPEDGASGMRTIEFDAVGAETALLMAYRHCPDRQAELFEDGRSLGTIRCAPNGFWMLSAAAPAAEQPSRRSPAARPCAGSAG